MMEEHIKYNTPKLVGGCIERDFTINSIYSDANGNLFDPFNGKDLEKGIINFIGDADERIKSYLEY